MPHNLNALKSVQLGTFVAFNALSLASDFLLRRGDKMLKICFVLAYSVVRASPADNGLHEDFAQVLRIKQ